MNKLNDFLALFKDKSINLNNQTININSEFIEKLKDLEKESARLEVEIDKLKHQKAMILQETMECERQILIWERKIELEKEMQETLDPSVGQQEITKLKKKLHLKELKFNELKKKQELIILEIEKVVNKRDNINLKYNAKEMNVNMDSTNAFKKKIKSNKKSQLAKNIQLFKSSIKQSQEGVKKLSKNLTNIDKENSVILQNIDDKQKDILASEKYLQNNLNFVKNFKVGRLVKIVEIFVNQQRALSLEKIYKRGKLLKPKEDLKNLLFDQKTQNKKFITTFKAVCEMNSEIKFILPYIEHLNDYI